MAEDLNSLRRSLDQIVADELGTDFTTRVLLKTRTAAVAPTASALLQIWMGGVTALLIAGFVTLVLVSQPAHVIVSAAALDSWTAIVRDTRNILVSP